VGWDEFFGLVSLLVVVSRWDGSELETCMSLVT
jgi:hypothetical protein